METNGNGEKPTQSTSDKGTTINIEIPSTKNLSQKRGLVPISFAGAIIFFFFTFCELKCGNERVISATGFQLVKGVEIQEPSMGFGSGKKKEFPPNIWAIFSLSAGIIGLGIYLLREKREALIGAGAGFVGAFSMLLLQISLKNSVDEQTQGKLVLDFLFPYWGSLIAFCFAGIVSYLRLKETRNPGSIATSPTPSSANQSAENVIQPQTIPPEEASFDIQEFYIKNKNLITGITAIGITLLIIYFLFLKHDPAKDGQSIASDICDCQKEQNEKLIEYYKNFDSNFEKNNYSGRAEARDKFQAGLQSVNNASLKCFDETREKLSQVKQRYIADKDQTEKFEYAYNAQQNICNSTNEELNALNSTVYNKINQYIGVVEREQRRVADSLATVEAELVAIEARKKAVADSIAKIEYEKLIQSRKDILIGNWVRKTGGSGKEGMIINFDGNKGTITFIPNKVRGFSAGQIKWKNYDPINLTIEELLTNGKYQQQRINIVDSKTINTCSRCWAGDVIYKKEQMTPMKAK